MPIAKMTSSVLKILGKKPSTRAYPFYKRPAFKDARGKIVIDIPLCIYCGICMRRCPANAIFTNIKEKVWTIDHFRCVNCKLCVDVCPKKCLSMESDQALPSTTRLGPEPSLKK
ncbi:MAG: 4Fe-4S dicluster domain-containing protein [Candidatus Omnitrophica bacterium]|nr:4Fe-4S dicluster domain-containing protein [Candidatus Omnitrophota bacterium]